MEVWLHWVLPTLPLCSHPLVGIHLVTATARYLYKYSVTTCVSKCQCFVKPWTQGIMTPPLCYIESNFDELLPDVAAAGLEQRKQWTDNMYNRVYSTTNIINVLYVKFCKSVFIFCRKVINFMRILLQTPPVLVFQKEVFSVHGTSNNMPRGKKSEETVTDKFLNYLQRPGTHWIL